MRLSALCTILFSALIFASCGKEASVEQPVVNPPATDTAVTVNDTTVLADNGGLLKRMVTRYEGDKDSLVSEFKYTADGKLIEMYEVVEGIASPNDLYSVLQQFHRNDKGLVDEIKLQAYVYDASLKPAFRWNSEYKIYFDETKLKYQYALVTGTDKNEPITDSLAYEYGLDNHLAAVTVYNFKASDTANFDYRYEYLFNSQGNIDKWRATSEKNYLVTENWTNKEFNYDNKLNPLNAGDETLLIGNLIFPTFPTVNNATVCGGSIYPEDNYAIQYTYNNHNKPVTAIWKYNNGKVKTIKYYYLQ